MTRLHSVWMARLQSSKRAETGGNDRDGRTGRSHDDDD
jgi:hypothetical protein